MIGSRLLLLSSLIRPSHRREVKVPLLHLPVDTGKFVGAGVLGAIVGFALSLPVLYVLNQFLLRKRPNADQLHSWTPGDFQRLWRSAKEEPALTERDRLTDSLYALSKGYIKAKELERLRGATLAVSEMSFSLAVIGVAAAIAFGIDDWAHYRTVGAIAAVAVFGFTLLGTERYHKFRSSYKTLVLSRLDEKTVGKKAVPRETTAEVPGPDGPKGRPPS